MEKGKEMEERKKSDMHHISVVSSKLTIAQMLVEVNTMFHVFGIQRSDKKCRHMEEAHRY